MEIRVLKVGLEVKVSWKVVVISVKFEVSFMVRLVKEVEFGYW